MSEKEYYKKILTELIKKQMVILGPNISLDKAKRVAGLKVASNGEVLDIEGDPKIVTKSLANEFIMLSGEIAQITINAILEKYPEVKDL